MHRTEQQAGGAEDQAADAAAAWIVRRERGLSPAEQREFQAWQEASPLHRSELERIDGAWCAMGALENDAELNALAARAWQQRRRRRELRIFATLGGLAAAAVLAFALARGDAFSRQARSDPGAPAAGQVKVLASAKRETRLPDGSVAELKGDSAIDIEFSDGLRRVRLTRGEAHFVVARDAARPFEVAAGPVAVRALGTAFNVRLDSTTIEVLVTEGRVQLERRAPEEASPTAPPPPPPLPLASGERALVPTVAGPAEPIAVSRLGEAEIRETLGWQSARLVFAQAPLEQVVAAFNRHNERQLVLGDRALGSRTLSGTFRADNLDGFIRLLGDSVDVRAEVRSSRETVLLPARR